MDAFSRRTDDSEAVCLELKWAPECGVFGTCKVISQLPNTSSAEECSCQEGFEKGTEMAVYFLPRTQIPNVGLCNQNLTIGKSLYGIVLLFSIIALAAQLWTLRSMAIARKIWAVLLGNLLAVIGVVYKLSDFRRVGFGSDLPFTIIVALIYLLNLLATLFYFGKFVRYLTTKIIVTNQGAAVTARRIAVLQPFVIVYDVCTYSLFVISAVLIQLLADDDFSEVPVVLLRIGFGMTALRTTYLLYISEAIFSRMVKDLEIAIKMQSDRRVVMMKQPTPLKKFLPRVKRLRIMTLMFALQWYISGFLPCLWPYFLYQFGYVIPTFQFFWTFVSLGTLSPPKKKHKRDQEKQNVKSSSLLIANLNSRTARNDSSPDFAEDNISAYTATIERNRGLTSGARTTGPMPGAKFKAKAQDSSLETSKLDVTNFEYLNTGDFGLQHDSPIDEETVAVSAKDVLDSLRNKTNETL